MTGSALVLSDFSVPLGLLPALLQLPLCAFKAWFNVIINSAPGSNFVHFSR
jgi:hypothetical protein